MYGSVPFTASAFVALSVPGCEGGLAVSGGSLRRTRAHHVGRHVAADDRLCRTDGGLTISRDRATGGDVDATVHTLGEMQAAAVQVSDSERFERVVLDEVTELDEHGIAVALNE